MNPVPLAALRLRPRDHLSALWWLALLYRRPRVFELDLEQLGRGQRLAAAVRMCLHVLPYVVVIAVLALLPFGAFWIPLDDAPTDLRVGSLVSFHLVRTAFGIAGGIAVRIVFAIALGITVGIVNAFAGVIASEIAGGFAGWAEGGFAEGEKGFLREVQGLKSHVAQLVREIRDFRGRVAGLRYPLSTAFRDAALAWLAVAERQHGEALRILENQPAAQVFRAGDPVERSQEAFLPRWPIIEELQGQITLATGCPGLLLYGRRRMGKSTLLKNLQPFLPTSITVASLSMLDPRVFGSLGQWVGSVAGCTAEAAGMAAPVCGDLGGLFTWLGTFDAALASDSRRVLLAIDEYENLDRKLGEELFPRDLLDTLRESIQRHRRITWLFAGSHALSELEMPSGRLGS